MTSEYIVFPTTQMGSCVEPNWTVLYDKILGLENQVTKISWQMQELCDGRITTIEDETAKLKQTILKWQSFSDVEFESESEIDTKTDSGGDFMGHIHPADAICISDAASTEQADTSDFIGNNTLDLGREGRGSLIQQESCSANIQPQSEPIRPNVLGEGNEHVDANPSFSPGLVEHYRDQEGLHNNTVPKRLNGETAREETTPKGVASAAVGGNEPPGDEGLHDETIPKNLNEEARSEENAPIAAASSAVKPPENEPPSRDTGGETNCHRDYIAREDADSKNAEQQYNGTRDFTKLIKNGNTALTERNRKALISNFCFLKDNLRPVIISVADYMFSKFVLPEHHLEAIESMKVTTEKCRYLVKDILLHSSEKTFWVFMEALEQNKCEFIVDKLLKVLGKIDVNGQLKVVVDFPDGRKAQEEAQRCLQKARCSVEEYIFNNPDRKPSMCDAIRSVMEHLNLTVNDTTRGSILMNMKFYTVEQLDAFWMWVKSRRPSPLSTSLTEVILTEEIRRMVPEDIVLSLSTDMDLDEYLKKRRRLLHGELPMTSDDSNVGRQPQKERNQSLLWLDIVGEPKEEANPKVLLEWAYESGYNDPLPMLTEKFPHTFIGFDEKDFRIERLNKLITYKNGRISQLIAKSEDLAKKLSQAEHKLKNKELLAYVRKSYYMDIGEIHRSLTEDLNLLTQSNSDIQKDWRGCESDLAGPVNELPKDNGLQASLGKSFPAQNNVESHRDGRDCDLELAQPVHVPTGEVNSDKECALKTNSDDLELPKDSGLQASGGHAEEPYDDTGYLYGQHVHRDGGRVRGLSTVICVDTSRSMEGEAFTDMKNAIHKILYDAKYTYNVYEFKELIGLVECGSGLDSRTLVSLTDNYDRIRQALAGLKPGGMSPLAAGISKSFHELLRHASRQMQRVLVFTDGKPTDENDFGNMDDLPRASSTGKHLVLNTVQNPVTEDLLLYVRIHFVGCGKNCDKGFLEYAAKAGKGEFFRADDELDVRCLGGYYRRLAWVSLFIRPIQGKLLNQLVNDKTKFSTWMHATKSTEIFDTDLSDFDVDEMHKILQALVKEDPRIQRDLPLGMRVRRGPDWEYGDQDNNGPGTVTGYRKGGWIKVQWDHSDEDFVYRYGHEGRRDLRAVDEPRILTKDELIKPGVKVRRGPHWHANNNDGGPGSIGTVYKVHPSGIVYVCWPTKVISFHRYGYDGEYEIETVLFRLFTLTDMVKTKLPVQVKVNREESLSPANDASITSDGKIALWQWNSNGNWEYYPKYVSTKLEHSYHTSPSTCVEVNIAGLCYVIDFESMTALCDDINETYEIQRTEVSLEDFEAVRVGLEGY
ncbi:uncharacterized protein LOC106181853 [Lingula anatina]|uniref:Uncharacterized protein LOC106181853 n=1 Tax=Lingula anatina TaxID=7574 RepID=A0A1S3KHW7_LINAN|nr:uncharacterized protein LOC106181853 [Lingula anatina]|eukprot:XP_013421821.1 uncharacterized protein LOC106181853 [Lingula anatina]